MKQSKIAIGTFVVLCLGVTIYYAALISQASGTKNYSKEYKAISFDTEINHLVIDDGWRFSVHIGSTNTQGNDNGGYRSNSSPEEVQILSELSGTGFLIRRYVPELDESLIESVRLVGDTLYFKTPDRPYSGFRRLRLNLENLESLNISGTSSVRLIGRNGSYPMKLDELSVVQSGESNLSFNTLDFTQFNLDASGHAQTSMYDALQGLSLYSRREAYDSARMDGKTIVINSKIKLYGSASMDFAGEYMRFTDFQLLDEAILNLGYKALITQKGTKYQENSDGRIYQVGEF